MTAAERRRRRHRAGRRRHHHRRAVLGREPRADDEVGARVCAELGIRVLRGGAYKPRTSPYSFQGLEEEGLKILREAADTYGLLHVTEVIGLRTCRDRGRLRRHPPDRHAQHGELLPAQEDRAGHAESSASPCCSSAAWRRRSRSGCRRASTSPMRQPERHPVRARHPYLRDGDALHARHHRRPGRAKLSMLPIIVDASHPTGQRDLVPAVCGRRWRSAPTASWSRCIPNPRKALCDGPQSLDLPGLRTCRRARAGGRTLSAATVGRSSRNAPFVGRSGLREPCGRHDGCQNDAAGTRPALRRGFCEYCVTRAVRQMTDGMFTICGSGSTRGQRIGYCSMCGTAVCEKCGNTQIVARRAQDHPRQCLKSAESSLHDDQVREVALPAASSPRRPLRVHCTPS